MIFSCLSHVITCFIFSGSEVVTVREFDWLKAGLPPGTEINLFALHWHVRTCLKNPVRTQLILGKEMSPEDSRYPSNCPRLYLHVISMSEGNEDLGRRPRLPIRELLGHHASQY